MVDRYEGSKFRYDVICDKMLHFLMFFDLDFFELGLEIEYTHLKVFYIVFEELSNDIYDFPF